MQVRFPAHVVALLATLALSGCATSNANRQSAEYQAGYGDGCSTGSARASRIQQEPQRNQELYEANADYRAGWASGYNVCGGNQSSGRF